VSSLSEQPASPGLSTHPNEPPRFNVVVIGASAGGIAALRRVLGDLPLPFPVAIMVVLHLSPDRPSVLTQVLARFTRMSVLWAEEGAALCPGIVYVAPRDRHLTFTAAGNISLVRSAAVHYSRPSVDILFASAARAFGSNVVAVVLTGNGQDGSAGAVAVHDAGGVVIAQDERSSEYFGMPREAIESGSVTRVVSLDAMALTLHRIVTLGAASLDD